MYCVLYTDLGAVYEGLTGSEGVGSIIALSPLLNEELPKPPPPRPVALPVFATSCFSLASSLAFRLIMSIASFSCVYTTGKIEQIQLNC